jgi:Na+:H+ antiporter, NhaA family
MARRIPTPAAHWSATPVERILGPMRRFIHQEQTGGILLLVATVIALVFANSPVAPFYDDLLHTYIGISVGPFTLNETLAHWINDGLMAIFFFVVGLEIKREILVGELATPRAAALPIIAAFGGAVVPALIYFAFNAGTPGVRGWGVPMATDIAFALGCLALLGRRVPFGIKVFLTALAIVDDLIAILVIAIFYAGELNFTALNIGFLVLAVLFGLNMLGFRQTLLYAGLGVVVWLAFLQSGVHATIAGVLVAMTVPARFRIDAPTFMERARELLRQFEASSQQPSRMLTDETQQTAVIELEEACEQVQAPLQKLEHSLHPWVSLFIMPVFALANAGVALSPSGFGGAGLPIVGGIVLGLVIGKPIGIVAATVLAVRLGISELPRGATWAHVLGAGVLAGIGFTMSLFIAALAFEDPQRLDSAKIGILVASLIAGIAGMTLLSRQPVVARGDDA